MIDEETSAAIALRPDTMPAAGRDGKVCANCGAPMLGAYCYACGQPEKGMIRHLASVLSDVADTVFNVDARVFRTLWPLYVRPGFLTAEYFVGRRTRYVTPFRLFFFLCVISIFAIQVNLKGSDIIHVELDGDFSSQQAPAGVEAQAGRELAALQVARGVAASTRGTRQIDERIAQVRKNADARIAYLKARAAAASSGQLPPPDPDADSVWRINGKPIWDPATRPIDVSWLPDFANAKLNDIAIRAKHNLITARHDQRPLIASVFSVLPQTMFVLMPLFAVLLKIVYVFKRRFYMEHLIVALHSHAFIFLSFLVIELAGLLLRGADNHAVWAVVPLKFAYAAAWIWLPIYLFLMQKRIYGQGWLMTTLKYCVVGSCYLLILSLGLVGALVTALAME